MKKRTAKNLPAAPYEPTPDEQAAVARYEKRKKALPVLPQMECKLTQTGERSFDAKIRMDHSHQPTAYKMIADALNSGSMPFVYGWLKEASGLGILKSGTMNMDQVNYAIAVATGIKPRDTIEAMLALQMAAVHIASMNAAATLSASSTAKGFATYENSLNKLGRTFTTQMEALKRYRSKGGNQRIVVERVNVSEGGQAIVGNVDRGEVR